MRTQQGFFKNNSPQNIHTINSNYINTFQKIRYNNFLSINKINTLYNINYNNNRKSNNEYINYSNKRINTENNEKYFLKSQNYFSKDFKSLRNAQRRKDVIISSNKNSNRTNIHFYSPKNNINYFIENLNSKNNLSTLPTIKAGFPIRNNQSQKKPNNTNFFNKNLNNISQNNNNISKLNDLNKFLNKNSNNSFDKNKSNNRYLQTSNFSSPTKINLIRNIKFNKSNNNDSNISPSLNFLLKEKFLLYKDAKYSDKSFDLISAYGANTYKGIIRSYNEDRISVIVNAKYNNQKMKKFNSPKVSYFGVYDGHAGNKCCDFLKNNLHNYIFKSEFFPDYPEKAIEQGFDACENKFIESTQIKNKNTKYKNNQIECSGSCAIIILIINDICYTINLGDSRALYSCDSGKIFYQLSRDHKPNDPIEKDRVYKAGGSIFKTNIEQYGINVKESDLGFKVPFRIIPGRLAVSKYMFIIFLLL